MAMHFGDQLTTVVTNHFIFTKDLPIVKIETSTLMLKIAENLHCGKMLNNCYECYETVK